MKRKLALLLALVMILSLVPMSAFAASSNRVDRVMTVSDDHKFVAANAPRLIIAEDKDAFTTETFRLNLTNAKWLDTMFTQVISGVTVRKDSDTRATVTINSATVVAAAAAADAAEATAALTDAVALRAAAVVAAAAAAEEPGNQVLADAAAAAAAAADAAEAADATAIALRAAVATAATVNGESFPIPMLVEAGVAGEIKVTIDPRESTISPGTYTFAVVGTGKTVAIVDEDAKTVQKGTNQLGATILIDELAVGAVNEASKVEILLPDGFEWNTNTEVKDFNGNAIVVTPAMIDKEELTITFNPPAGTTRRTASIIPRFNVTKDADLGDVVVDIHGGGDVSDASNLKIAVYKDFGITVELDSDLETFRAGILKNDVIEVKIEETIANSLFDGRTIEFELPDWVQVQAGEAVQAVVKDGATTTLITGDPAKSTNEFEFTAPSVDGKTEIIIKLPLTFKADEAGDVELVIKGAGIEKTELKIAEVIAPVKAEVKVADLQIGLQNQAAPEIIITEAEAGALMEKDLVLTLDGIRGMRFTDADVEVVAGDLKVGGIKVEDSVLTVDIDRDSNRASKIRIYNIKMTLDRTVPHGSFDLSIGGPALVQNADYDDKDFGNTVAEFKFANVVTLADGNVATTSKFVIGSTTYKVLVGGVEVAKTMDVAPFIENGRTFLPIRFVAEAVGVAVDNVIWNEEARTVTILKGERVIGLTIGSNVLTVNGTPIVMDTAAMIKDGRTVLPVRFVAQALGAAVAWDEATQTVTVTQ